MIEALRHRTSIPWRDLYKALDSEVAGAALDSVDLSRFEPDKRFSQKNLSIMMALSACAYASPCDQRGLRTMHDPESGCNVSVWENSEALVVGVSGASAPWIRNFGKENSLELRDWLEAFRGYPTRTYDGSALVHSGFKNQADGIWPSLKPLLQTALETDKAVHFCGHSMGGAVAMMLADRMQFETGELPTSVMRFGSPEVGWDTAKKHFAETGLAERVYSVTNSGDPIPRILPGGESVGTEIFLDGRGHAHVGDGAHFGDRVATKVYDVLTGKALVPLYRHFPQFYLKGTADEGNSGVFGGLER